MELKKMIEGITKKSPADQQLYNKEDAGGMVMVMVMVVVMVVVMVMVTKIVSVMEDITNYHLLYQDPPQWEGLFPLSRIQTMSPNLHARRWRHSL